MISIIIPFYNTGESCAELLKQLLNDRQEDIEIICIDDCSTDNSLKMVHEVAKKDSRIKVISLEKNSGSATARNRGLEEARGDYVVFLDSDDDVADLFLTKMLKNISKNNVVLAVCGIRQNYLTTNKIIDKFTTPASMRNEDEKWEEYVLRLMTEDARLYSSVNKIYSGKMIRKSRIRFDEKLRFAEDTKFVLDYLKAASECDNPIISFVLDPLYTYNYGTSTSVVSESSLVWDNWEKQYKNTKKFVNSDSKNAYKLLRRLYRRFKISHALAVARSRKKLKEKIKYENPVILAIAKVIVLIRG